MHDAVSGGVVFKDGVWGFLGVPYSAFLTLYRDASEIQIKSNNVLNGRPSSGVENQMCVVNNVLMYCSYAYNHQAVWEESNGITFKRTINFDYVNRIRIYIPYTPWAGSGTTGDNWVIYMTLHDTNKKRHDSTPIAFMSESENDYTIRKPGWYYIDVSGVKGHLFMHILYYGMSNYPAATGDISQIVLSK